MQLQIAVKPSVLCCHLANTNEELGGLATSIPPFVKLFRSLFHRLCSTSALCTLHSGDICNTVGYGLQATSCI